MTRESWYCFGCNIYSPDELIECYFCGERRQTQTVIRLVHRDPVSAMISRAISYLEASLTDSAYFEESIAECERLYDL
jgi:hypothetical protein